MRGLAGKVALVAGGGSGIGAATAARLAEEGAAVAVGDVIGENARRVADGIAQRGGRAVGIEFDIRSEESVDELVTRAVAEFGGIDCVHVNAADLSPDTIQRDGDIETVPLEVFDHSLAVGLRGHLLVTRRVVRELLARRGGALVYTSSAAAFMGEPTRISYAVMKNGLHALLRHVASRWGKDNVRANAVAPGLVLTDQILAQQDPAMFDAVLQATRSPRLGRPEDIAAAVAFLCSDDAEWINGQVLSVDGGTVLR